MTAGAGEDWEARVAAQGRRYRAAVERAEAERHKLAGLVGSAVAAGVSEVRAARAAGVTRQTVRAWLGKPRRRVD